MRITSALVGKAYSAAGQAAACLHTMSLLQAYQAELLIELDEVEGFNPNLVCKLRRATDLSLRAAKEMAKSIGRSMAALVTTERHLWLNLSNIKGKDKNFLMDAPISPSGFSIRLSRDSRNQLSKKMDLRTVINSKKAVGKRSWCPRAQASEDLPPRSRAVNTSFYGAHLPSMSSGDRSANPAI